MSFCVEPKRDCPHVVRPSQEIIAKGAHCIAASACSSCGDTNENWMDLHDGSVNCSREINGHASLHARETSHALAASFSDLSVWCYTCDSYITSPLLSELLQSLSAAKHATPASSPPPSYPPAVCALALPCRLQSYRLFAPISLGTVARSDSAGHEHSGLEAPCYLTVRARLR